MSRRFWVAAFGALFVLLLGVSLERVAERGRFARAFSSYGSGPEGVRALYLLMGELGFATVRWSQDLARLPPGAPLIALGSCASGMARPISRYEHTELLRWIASGGTLVVAGARNYLPRELDIGFRDDVACGSGLRELDGEPWNDSDDEHAAEPAADGGMPDAGAAPDAGVAPDAGATFATSPPASHDEDCDDDSSDPRCAPQWGVPMGPSLEGLPIVAFRAPGRLRLPDDDSVETLLGVPPPADAGDPEITPLAVTRAHGAGRVIVLASASMLQNGEIEASEGATLFARLIRSFGAHGPLIFDEYHLGLGERRSLMQYLRQSGAMPAVLQLLLVAALALWRAGARIGAVQQPPEAQPAGTISFVTALGQLYAKAGDRTAAVRLIARAALVRIAGQHGITQMKASALEAELSRRGARRASASVHTIIAAANAAKTEPLPGLVARIDAAVSDATVVTKGHRKGPG
jgi:hypothetical protein